MYVECHFVIPMTLQNVVLLALMDVLKVNPHQLVKSGDRV